MSTSSLLNTVILSAPQGWGKSLKAPALMQEFGCTRVVDDWFKGDAIQPGALHLTHMHGSALPDIPPNVRLVTRGW